VRRHLAGPGGLFRTVALAEAVTWALLLAGMSLKYTHVTELGVRVFGMLHGVVFLGYCLTTLVVAVDQRWSRGRTLVALAGSVPPFATLAVERYVERHDPPARQWRLVGTAPTGRVERVTAWLLRNPVHGATAGLVAVAALTGVALLVGPPAG
jgi:integral membrane protein